MANSLGRGRKQCPACEAIVGVRTKLCDCGHEFIFKRSGSAKAAPQNHTGHTVEQVLNAVTLIRNLLTDRPKLSIDELLEASTQIDLNEVLSVGMKAKDVQQMIAAKDSREASAKTLAPFRRSEVNELLVRTQKLMSAD